MPSIHTEDAERKSLADAASSREKKLNSMSDRDKRAAAMEARLNAAAGNVTDLWIVVILCLFIIRMCWYDTHAQVKLCRARIQHAASPFSPCPSSGTTISTAAWIVCKHIGWLLENRSLLITRVH